MQKITIQLSEEDYVKLLFVASKEGQKSVDWIKRCIMNVVNVRLADQLAAKKN